MIAHRYVHMEALLDGWRLFLMNDHLDECPEVFIDCYGTLCDCEYSHFCICDALRACEARVTALATPESVSQANYWYEQGQQDFLNAAVQRVKAHLIMLDNNGWRATLNGEGYSDLEGFGPGVIAAIKGDSDA
jgi:hypothetical protein